jgi:hypothetical protein
MPLAYAPDFGSKLIHRFVEVHKRSLAALERGHPVASPPRSKLL